MELFRRFIPALLNLLLTSGLQVSGYTNLYIGIALWALMVPLILFALWPWLRRNAEFQQLNADLQAAGQEHKRLEERIEQLEQESKTIREERDALVKENEELIKAKNVAPEHPPTSKPPQGGIVTIDSTNVKEYGNLVEGFPIASYAENVEGHDRRDNTYRRHPENLSSAPDPAEEDPGTPGGSKEDAPGNKDS